MCNQGTFVSEVETVNFRGEEAAGEPRAVKRLVAKVRQPQPNSLPNQPLPLDWLCDIMAFRINRYFTIVA